MWNLKERKKMKQKPKLRLFVAKQPEVGVMNGTKMGEGGIKTKVI